MKKVVNEWNIRGLTVAMREGNSMKISLYWLFRALEGTGVKGIRIINGMFSSQETLFEIDMSMLKLIEKLEGEK